MDSTNRPLTTAEVSARTGIPAATLRYWRHRNTGPRCWRQGRHVVYDVADLEARREAQKAGTERGGGGALDERHATFTRWRVCDYDIEAIDAVIAAAAAIRLDGDPVWLLLVGG